MWNQIRSDLLGVTAINAFYFLMEGNNWFSSEFCLMKHFYYYFREKFIFLSDFNFLLHSFQQSIYFHRIVFV